MPLTLTLALIARLDLHTQLELLLEEAEYGAVTPTLTLNPTGSRNPNASPKRNPNLALPTPALHQPYTSPSPNRNPDPNSYGRKPNSRGKRR